MEENIKIEAQLLALVNDEAQESLTLEFKRSNALGKTSHQKSEISKDVSAMANSAGGTILYGIAENDHVAKSVDDGVDPNDISKEWLEQVINSTVSKRIDGIIIHQIPLKSSGMDKVAFSVNIPKSSRAPHQASDKKFYKRFNFQSVAMEEYEIEDIRNRTFAPALRLTLQLPVAHIAFDHRATHSHAIRLQPTIHNDSATLAIYTLVDLFIDGKVKVDAPSDYEIMGTHEVDIDGNKIVCTRLTCKLSTPKHMPIWNGQGYSLPEITLRVLPAPTGNSYVIAQRISSPGMTVSQGFRVLDVGSANSIRLSEIITDDQELVSRLGL